MEVLEYMIIPGTVIGYILGQLSRSGGGTVYFGILLSSSGMHKWSKYEFITYKLLQGKKKDLIMI